MIRRFSILKWVVFALIAGCGSSIDLDGDANGSLEAVCPPAMQTIPLADVELAGMALPDGPEISYDWTLLSIPEGSSAEPPQPGNERVSHFVPDVVGDYTVELTVTDEAGARSSCEVNIAAAAGGGLHIELYWNPPESPEDRSNADLHLLHEDAPWWFHYLLDCYWNNCTTFSPGLDWYPPGPEGDPSLDQHDTEGFGPEITNVLLPVEGSMYTVGVHFYQGNGLDEADIYVRIFCGSGSMSPVFEAGPVRMQDYRGSTDGNDFFKVAEVSWEGNSCSVAPIGEMVLALAAMRER
jgi:hypothetical protein